MLRLVFWMLFGIVMVILVLACVLRLACEIYSCNESSILDRYLSGYLLYRITWNYFVLSVACISRKARY